jgi:hypothetical protein
MEKLELLDHLYKSLVSVDRNPTYISNIYFQS